MAHVWKKGDKITADLMNDLERRADKVGDPFSISKVYTSVSEMNADFTNSKIKEGQFVVISTGDVNDEDNAKLYVKGSSSYTYITDLSGADGLTGPAGKDGTNGKDGKDGIDGANGITPSIDPTTKHWMIGNVDTGIVAQGSKGDPGTDGKDGTNGKDGKDGADGKSPTIAVGTNTDDTYTLIITNPDGTTFETPNLKATTPTA